MDIVRIGSSQSREDLNQKYGLDKLANIDHSNKDPSTKEKNDMARAQVLDKRC